MTRARLPLPPGVARCPSTRIQPCARADECARGVALHEIGRPVNDFSTEPRMPGQACGWFLPIRYMGQTVAAPKVHDAPGWLR